MASQQIPVLLLKTRTQPDDGYEEYFANLKAPSSSKSDSKSSKSDSKSPATPKPHFLPQFIPVLEHQPNTDNLTKLSDLLRSGTLSSTYGGIIFTSQRAVEGFSDVVRRIDASHPHPSLPTSPPTAADPSSPRQLPPTNDAPTTPSPQCPFPLYVVGPATARSLSSLLLSPTSPILAPLHPIILGAHTGNGAALASYILTHYNALHAQILFTYYAAPRLPFIPLVGPASGQYARKRMEWEDERLKKRRLLFLVGETRRDVIPKTLMGAEGLVEGVGECGPGGRGEGRMVQRRVEVEEWEVYRTVVRDGFGRVFGETLKGLDGEGKRVVVVVVFSPQGCEAMLRGVGLLGEGEERVDGHAAEGRWDGDRDSMEEGPRTRYLIATIGPTTRDYLKDTFGFEPDVCAEKPTPKGVGQGVLRFLEQKGLL